MRKKSNEKETPSISKKEKEKIEKEKNIFFEMDGMDKYFVVQQKIKEASKGNIDNKTLNDFSKKLSTSEGIKTAYLNKDFQNAIEYFKSIPKEKKKKVMVSNVEIDVPESIMNEDDEDENFSFEKEDEEFLMKTNEKLKVKLVITEIAKSEKEKTLRKLLSPVASTLNIGPKCGNQKEKLNSFSNLNKECFILHFQLDLGI